MKPELPLTHADLETSRRKLVNKIIQGSVQGKLHWDFSKFDDSESGRIAVARANGFIFVSTRLKGEDEEFSVFQGNGCSDTIEIDTLTGFKARLLRGIIERLAWQDATYVERQRLEERKLLGEESLSMAAIEDRTMRLGQVLELLAA